MPNTRNFTRFAWLTLAFTIGVILWGAYVRATGSGAGCGAHWPTCNGRILPQSEQTATLIEFTHRITSALSGLLVLIMLGWAWRLYPKGHLVRRAAGFSLFFMITEGAVGAGLVLFELVAYNVSVERAIAAAVHLTNTFLLVATISLTAWWSSRIRPFRIAPTAATKWLLGIGLVGILVVGSAGAITALGDTIFRPETLAEGIRQDFAPDSSFLVRLRLWHPIVAVLVSFYLFFANGLLTGDMAGGTAVRLSHTIRTLVLIQLAVGLLNIALLAPIWLQLIHLLLADFVWIALVLFAAEITTIPQPANPLHEAAVHS